MVNGLLEEAIWWLLKEGQEISMSKQYPECPLYNHNNCKEIHNRKVCAIVRKDKKCLKKLHKSAKKAKKQPVTKRLAWTDS